MVVIRDWVGVGQDWRDVGERAGKKKATKYSKKKTSNQRHFSKIKVTVLKLLSETTELRLCCRDNN